MNNINLPARYIMKIVDDVLAEIDAEQKYEEENKLYIERKAYALWQEHGHPHGKSEYFWEQARQYYLQRYYAKIYSASRS